MLLYILEEERVGKSQIVKALEMRFAFFDRCKELVILALTGCAIEGIESSIMHTTLGLNTHCGRNYMVKIYIKWSLWSSLIVDEVRRVDFRLFISIDK